MNTTPTLTEIAARIQVHLSRFEADKTINAPYRGIPPYYRAGAWRAGRYVGVRYVSFQHETSLTRTQALAYLTWLDAGNVGRHYQALASNA